MVQDYYNTQVLGFNSQFSILNFQFFLYLCGPNGGERKTYQD